MSLSLFDLSGKRALLTGATHGLGMSMAVGLAKAGAQIVINDISQEKLDAAIKNMQSWELMQKDICLM